MNLHDVLSRIDGADFDYTVEVVNGSYNTVWPVFSVLVFDDSKTIQIQFRD